MYIGGRLHKARTGASHEKEAPVRVVPVVGATGFEPVTSTV